MPCNIMDRFIMLSLRFRTYKIDHKLIINRFYVQTDLMYKLI